MKISRLLLFLSLALYTGLCIAQQCRGSQNTSATEERFMTLPSGEIADQRSHLIWMRCSVGQKWDSEKNTCTGQALLLTWPQVARLVKKPENKVHQWRLPSIHELSSITELRCYDPAIDLRLFPQTPPFHYWSATPFPNIADHFWLVQFLNGENHTDSGRRLAHARLVKPMLLDNR